MRPTPILQHKMASSDGFAKASGVQCQVWSSSA